jgi:hypothetical protein
MNIINIKKTKKFLKSNTGFAMLFAVLTASLLLTIGISIFNISLKELTISTNTRESQIAFFAADSARECALYWDVKVGALQACLDSSCGAKTELPAGITLASVMCNGVLSGIPIPVSSGPTITYASSSFFRYSQTNNLDPEADITVTKTFNSSDNSIKTTISAKGHNTGVLGRRLERAIEQTSIQ